MLSPVERELFLDTSRNRSAGCPVKTEGHSVWVFAGMGFQDLSCGPRQHLGISGFRS